MTINVISESEYFPKGHGVHTAFLNTVAMLKSKGLKVKINSLSSSDITHIHTIGPLGLYKLLISKNRVVTAHVIPDSFIGSLVGAKYWAGLAGIYLRFFYNRADLVLAVGPIVKVTLKSLGVKSRIEVLPNSIDCDKFTKTNALRVQGRKLLNLEKDEFVVLAVGQIQARKGVVDFLEVAKSLPEITFLWVGNKPFGILNKNDPKLEALLKEKLPNVRFAGLYSYNDMPSIYNAADVHFQATYQETMGMSIIEAGACKVPLVARDIPELKALYKNNYLAGKNVSEFVVLLKKLKNNKNLYKEMSNRIYEESQNFCFTKVGNQLVNYYQSLL